MRHLFSLPTHDSIYWTHPCGDIAIWTGTARCALELLFYPFLSIYFSVKATNEELLDAGVKTYNDIVTALKSGVRNLESMKKASNVAESIKNLKSEMGSAEQDTLDALSKVSSEN